MDPQALKGVEKIYNTLDKMVNGNDADPRLIYMLGIAETLIDVYKEPDLEDSMQLMPPIQAPNRRQVDEGLWEKIKRAVAK